MTRIDLVRLAMITPKAKPEARLAFSEMGSVLPAFDLVTPLRIRHFLAQCLHETGGFSVLVENLNYSAERLMAVWPSRFPTVAAAKVFAHAPRLLANHVYRGRLGNREPEDGWRYIGRGFLQLTGRDNYARVGQTLGIDLEQFPEKAAMPAYALAVAACIWKDLGCNAEADEDDLQGVTRRVNGGLTGLVSRRAWLNQTAAVVLSDEVKA